MIDALSRRFDASTRQRQERGFTLIELLVVIIILGILAAVVVFAVNGVGDKGLSSARAIDVRTISTAQEAFNAKFGRYASMDELVSEQFLSAPSKYHETYTVPEGTPDSAGNGGNSDTSQGGYVVTCAATTAGCGEGGALKLGWQTLGLSQAPSNTFLKDVHFVDHLNGWAVGGDISGLPTGDIIATTDGGQSWLPQSLPVGTPNTDLQSVDFVDANRGWAVGSRVSPATATILAYTGVTGTWSLQTLPAVGTGTVTLRGVDFIDANRGWAVGTNGTILNTTDGGATWNVQRAFNAAPAVSMNAVKMINDQVGWAVGSNASGFDAFHTTDGGQTWTPRLLGAPMSDITFAGPMRGWAPATSGRVVATIDGGANWAIQTAGGVTSNQTSASFVNERLGWSMGSNISRTTDGGNTWAIQATGASLGVGAFEGVHFLDAAHGWAVARGNHVRYYGPLP